MRAREVMNGDGREGGREGEKEGEKESSRRCCEGRERGNPHTSVKNSLCRESRLALSSPLSGEEERCAAREEEVSDDCIGTCKIISINFLASRTSLWTQPWPSRS